MGLGLDDRGSVRTHDVVGGVIGRRLWPVWLALLSAFLVAPTGARAACSAPVPTAGDVVVVGCPSIGAEQSFVVPRGVTTLRVVAIGARGGFGGLGPPNGNPGPGGLGAIVSASIRVTPGMRLFVLVGGIGADHPRGASPGAGGFNGGGLGSGAPGATATFGSGGGGGGGGASDVRTCSISDRSCDTLASRLIVAGGGGGGGGGNQFNDFSPGGGGGDAGTDADGGDGEPPSLGFGGVLGGGGGATRIAGGSAGGAGAGAGTRGAGGSGGPANEPSPSPPGGGGGGGGGLYGGGGGAAGSDSMSAGAGGGGGSSFGPSGATFRPASPLLITGSLPPPSVTIAYAPPPATPPSVVITRPRSGEVLRRFAGTGTNRARRRLLITGRARDASAVQSVALSIERLPRRTASGDAKRCVWLHHTRGLRAGRCDRPSPLIARLSAGGSWRYRVARRIKLPAGRYRVSAVGQDDEGAFGNAAPQRSRVITFRLSTT